jgi:steroid delta-isomerase-like uncharacterized protein
VVDVWDQVWNQGDPGAFDALLSPDYERMSGTEGKRQTAADLKGIARTTLLAFPDLVTKIDDLIEQDDTIALRWYSHGHHDGTLSGIPATGIDVHVSGVVFYEFEGDQVRAEMATWDSRQLHRAIGFVNITAQDDE